MYLFAIVVSEDALTLGNPPSWVEYLEIFCHVLPYPQLPYFFFTPLVILHPRIKASWFRPRRIKVSDMSSTKNGLLKVVAVSGIDGRTAGSCFFYNQKCWYLTGLEEGIAFFVSAGRYASGKSFASKFSEPVGIIAYDPGKLNEGHQICT